MADAVAVTILVFGLYFPRYGRRDMVVALLGINVGVLAVATVLSSADVSAGLGLGLFGVLSIIRLRSNELGQEEIAYYFTALALGLLGGLELVEHEWASPALMAGILVVLFLGDHPKLFADVRRQTLTLDSAYLDERKLQDRVEELIGAPVNKMRVRRVDVVNDTTTVEVRFVRTEQAEG